MSCPRVWWACSHKHCLVLSLRRSYRCVLQCFYSYTHMLMPTWLSSRLSVCMADECAWTVCSMVSAKEGERSSHACVRIFMPSCMCVCVCVSVA